MKTRGICLIVFVLACFMAPSSAFANVYASKSFSANQGVIHWTSVIGRYRQGRVMALNTGKNAYTAQYFPCTAPAVHINSFGPMRTINVPANGLTYVSEFWTAWDWPGSAWHKSKAFGPNNNPVISGTVTTHARN